MLVYTINIKTHVLERYLGTWGLEIVGKVLGPVDYVVGKIHNFWTTYVYLVDVKKENDQLKAEISQLRVENTFLRTRLNTLQRFEKLFNLKPFPPYKYTGARVIAKRLGPSGLLESIVIDKGFLDGLKKDSAVFSPKGLIGRIQKIAPHTSVVLLAVDPNSKVAVISEKNRTPGILQGGGYTKPGNLLYVLKSYRLDDKELLLTSGADEIFPPGIPVARVTSVTKENLSLFLNVKVKFEVDPYLLENVLVMTK
ncbi:MAG: rod shape-determining protein MreC [Desulfonauticus sp.]|nr:rod shape-determining protein MreC [Desulfonauticus sp.]